MNLILKACQKSYIRKNINFEPPFNKVHNSQCSENRVLYGLSIKRLTPYIFTSFIQTFSINSKSLRMHFKMADSRLNAAG